MSIEISKGHCTDREQAIKEITDRGLHLYEAEAEEGFEDEIHWHPYDTHIYVIEGEYEHREPDGTVAMVSAGDYQFTPARALHGALVTKKVKVVFGTNMPTDPGKPRHSPDEL